MTSLASVLSLVFALSLGAPDVGALLEEAETLHQQYGATEDFKEKSSIRSKINTLFKKLETSKEDRLVEGIARFYDFPELDRYTTSVLVKIDTKSARRAIGGVLRAPEVRRGARPGSYCRRAGILAQCNSLSKSFPSSLLKEVLSQDAHHRGVKAVLGFMVRRLTLKKLRAVLDALDESAGDVGLGAFEEQDRQELVVDFINKGFHLRGRGPRSLAEGQAGGKKDGDASSKSSRRKKTEELSPLGKLSEKAAREIYDTLLEYARDESRRHVTRGVAIRALGNQKKKSVLKVVQKVLEKESEYRVLLMAATEAAVDLGEPAAGDWLFPVIEREMKALPRKKFLEEELLTLIEAIYPLKIKKAEPLLRKLLRSRNVFLQMAAIRSLPVMGDEKAKPLLEKYLARDRVWRVQIAAIQACRRMRSKVAVDLLINRMAKQQGRLKFDLLMGLHDLTGIQMPYVAEDWKKWWEVNRGIYKPPEERPRPKSNRKTVVLFPEADKATYFGMRILSKRLCFIGDTSGSMSGQMNYEEGKSVKIDVMKGELLRLVKTFRRKTYYNIFFFSSAYKKCFKQLTEISNKSYRTMQKFVTGAAPTGGTNLYDPLEEALEDPYVDTIYVLSDGMPSAGKYTAEEDILRAVRRINRIRCIQINTISIGTDSPLMRTLAEENDGLYRFLK